MTFAQQLEAITFDPRQMRFVEISWDGEAFNVILWDCYESFKVPGIPNCGEQAFASLTGDATTYVQKWCAEGKVIF